MVPQGSERSIMTHYDWRDTAALKAGTTRQRRVVELLERHRVFDILAAFDPVLAGTVPLDIDVEGSDLDIICEVVDPSQFASCLQQHFGRQPGFRLSRSVWQGQPTTIAGFALDGEQIEVFGQAVPVDLQAAVVHLDVEARLLALAGDWLRISVRELKRGGMKTEPAFAQLLGIHDDPYQALYAMVAWSDDRLRQLFEEGHTLFDV